jgi:hypothetical protein
MGDGSAGWTRRGNRGAYDREARVRREISGGAAMSAQHQAPRGSRASARRSHLECFQLGKVRLQFVDVGPAGEVKANHLQRAQRRPPGVRPVRHAMSMHTMIAR